MTLTFRQVLHDLFSFPTFGRAVWLVFTRNLHFFRYTIFRSVFWVVLEPTLYLLAIGYGVGQFVGSVEGQSYAEFFLPSIMAISAMLIACFESTYSSYARLAHQHTFDVMLMTPADATEIAFGEILWAAFKGFLSVLSVTAVAYALGLIHTGLILPVLGTLFLVCWVFAALGLLISTHARSFNWFIFIQSGCLIPMSLFSGTYFPLKTMPEVAQKFALLFPLTHGVIAARTLLGNRVDATIFLNIGVLFITAVFLTNLATANLKRRLMK